MAILTLQIGQCGNQIGQAFFQHVHKNTPPSNNNNTTTMECNNSRWFRSNNIARAILIDMEPKVIQNLQGQKYAWHYSNENAIWKQSGSGNNWAFGYNVHGPACEEIIEMVKKEMEYCDVMEGFIMYHSLAGGTGSGMGSYLTELLANAFSAIPILNVVVAPYKSGEVSVQPYNGLLTLSCLAEVES